MVEQVAKASTVHEPVHEPIISVNNKTRTPDGRKLSGSASSDWIQEIMARYEGMAWFRDFSAQVVVN